jgi:hypothetical protein
MFKKLGLWLVAALATSAMQASTIDYNAYIVGPDAVQVGVYWEDISEGVYFIDVTDASGNILFGLSNPFFQGATTGFNYPYPETVSGLSQETMDIISGGGVGVPQQFSLFSISQLDVEAGAFLNLYNQVCREGFCFPGQILASTSFVAVPVPEPSAWLLGGLGLAGVVARRRFSRRSAR